MSGIQARIQDYGLNSVGDGPLTNISNVRVMRQLDGAGSFSFNAPLSDSRAITLATNERRAVLYIYQPNNTSRELASGIIRNRAEQGDSWQFGGPDLLAELANENTLVNRVYNGTPIADVLDELIALVRSNHNLCVGGTASASSIDSTLASWAFDGDPTTYWQSSPENTPWLEYTFPNAVSIGRYSLQGVTDINNSWTLQSYNGATWDTADTRGGEECWLPTEKRVYDCDTPGASSTRWRIQFQATLGDVRVYEMTMSPLTDWTLVSTGVTGDFYGRFDGVSILKAFQIIANATGYHFRVEADRTITFGALGDTAALTVLQAGTFFTGIEENDEIAILDQPLRRVESENMVNWIMPSGKGTPPLTLKYLNPASIGSLSIDYDETNLTGWVGVNQSPTAEYRRTQSFTPPQAGTYVIFAVELYLRRVGTLTDEAILSFWDNSSPPQSIGIVPTHVSAANISTTGEWVLFWLNKPVALTGLTKYWISLSTSQDEDASNHLEWGVDGSGSLLLGNASVNDVWASSGTSDHIFRLWRTTDATTFYTPQRIVGPDGEDQWYLYDSESVVTYGKVAASLTLDVEAQGGTQADLENGAYLTWRGANSWLEKHANPQTTYQASVTKAYSTIYPGQLVRLVYRGNVYDETGTYVEWADIDDTFYVISVTETIGNEGKVSAQLNLSTLAQLTEDNVNRIVSTVEQYTIDGARRYYGPTIQAEQSGVAFTPPAGKWSIYPKSDGYYELDDAGVETKLANVNDAVLDTLFDANSILKADADNTPEALVINEQQIVGRITGGEITGLSVAQGQTLLDVLPNALLNANTIVKADSDNTPVALDVATNSIVGRQAGSIDDIAIGEQTLLGRITGGNIAALTVAQVSTLLKINSHAARAVRATSTQSINTAEVTIVNFNSVEYDDDSCIATGASWRYRCPEAGRYRVSAVVTMTPNTDFQLGDVVRLMVYKGGAFYCWLDQQAVHDPTNHAVAMSGSDTVDCALNDDLDVRLYQASGATLAISNSSGVTHVAIEKIPG